MLRKLLPIRGALAFALASLIGSSALAADLLEVELKEDVVYGSGAGDQLKLDLAKPREAKEPLPGILFIHGGGWQAGNKKVYRQAIQEFAANGYVVGSVGYRFAPKHRAPAQIEDVKCAVRWMRANAKDLNLNPEKIGAIGASAGGHLATMLGVMDSSDGCEGEGGCADQSSKVQCVVNYFGPTNLVVRELDGSPVKGLILEDAVRGILTNFVGSKPEESADALRRVSPITYVNKGDAPILMFQGTKDQLVPYDQVLELASALTKAGIPGRIEIILGAGHGWGGDEMKRTQSTALEFFDEHLKGS